MALSNTVLILSIPFLGKPNCHCGHIIKKCVLLVSGISFASSVVLDHEYESGFMIMGKKTLFSLLKLFGEEGRTLREWQTTLVL